MDSKGKRIARALAILLVLAIPLLLAGVQLAYADQGLVRSESVQLNVGDSLVIHSNQLTIQQVFLEGNLSAASIAKPTRYPASNLEVNASAPGDYQLRVVFNQSTDYTVNLYVRQGGTDLIDNSTSYYVSGGSFELDVTAYFNPNAAQAIAQPSSVSPWDGFSSWTASFGQAFPAWVKVLYLLLGVQFLAVGGLWIRRESARKTAATQRLDSGDKVYLLVDVVYKFLLTSFVAIILIMGGELILLFILRVMFLISLNLLSLWDLFVVGFALGAVILVYMTRFVLEKAFDLKPLEDE